MTDNGMSMFPTPMEFIVTNMAVKAPMPVRCKLIFHRNETNSAINSQQAAATMNLRMNTAEPIRLKVSAHKREHTAPTHNGRIRSCRLSMR